MKNKMITVNADLLENDGVLSSILLEIYLVRYEAFKVELSREICRMPSGSHTTNDLKAIEIRLKNYLELSLISKLNCFAQAYNLTFDIHATMDFMEEYLIAVGEIKPINVKREIVGAVLELQERLPLMSPNDPTLGDNLFIPGDAFEEFISSLEMPNAVTLYPVDHRSPAPHRNRPKLTIVK